LGPETIERSLFDRFGTGFRSGRAFDLPGGEPKAGQDGEDGQHPGEKYPELRAGDPVTRVPVAPEQGRSDIAREKEKRGGP
jgi:hypothetical protein